MKAILDRSLWIFCFLVLLHAAVSLSRIISTTAPDFSVYYGAAKYLLHGRSLYTNIDLYTGVGYPPHSIVFYIPLTFFPYMYAQALWTICSFFALGYVVLWSIKIIKPDSSKQTLAILLSLAFLSFPVKFTLGMGQVTLVALAFFLYGLKIKSNQYKLSLFVVGVACMIKPHFLLVLPYLWFSGEKKYVLYLLLWQTVLIPVVGMVFGWSQYIEYVTKEIPMLLPFQGRDIYYNQGLSGLWFRILDTNFARTFTNISSFFILGIGIWNIHRNKYDNTYAFTTGLTTLLLLEPLSWQHHYVLLIPVFISVLYAKNNTLQKYILCLLSYMFISYNIKHPDYFTSSIFGRLILSHGTIGTMVLWYLLMVQNKKNLTQSPMRQKNISSL